MKQHEINERFESWQALARTLLQSDHRWNHYERELLGQAVGHDIVTCQRTAD